MDYITNSQLEPPSEWINKGNNFLQSKYGAALYIIALIIIVILYFFGSDFTSFKNTIMSSFKSDPYATSTTSSGMGKGATIVVGLSGVLVLIGIILYLIRLYNYKNGLVVNLISNVTDGKNMKMFSEDTVALPASSNREGGLEFAYSTWLKISDWTYNATLPKYILVKGKLSGSNNIISQAPSIQLTSTNTLRVSTQTYGSGLSRPLLTESVELPDIPLKRWFHLLVGVSGRNLDIYINGILVKRKVLDGLIELNKDPLYVSPSINDNNKHSMSGFGGLLYDLKYFAYYPSQEEIMQLVQNEPSKDAAACK
jgi:hypothetical protein